MKHKIPPPAKLLLPLGIQVVTYAPDNEEVENREVLKSERTSQGAIAHSYIPKLHFSCKKLVNASFRYRWEKGDRVFSHPADRLHILLNSKMGQTCDQVLRGTADFHILGSATCVRFQRLKTLNLFTF